MIRWFQGAVRNGSGARPGCCVFVACTFLMGSVAFGVSVPDERVLYRDVVGRVVDAVTGAPVAGAPVSLLYEMATTEEDGTFRFEKVPLTHTALVSIRVQSKNSGLIIGCITVDVPVKFYPVASAVDGRMDVRIVDPGSEEPVELRLRGVGGEKVDDTCRTCHEDNPCLETASYQDVIASGKDLRGIIVREDKVESFKTELQKKGLRVETYRKMRYQDTHPDGMNMEQIPLLELAEYKGLFQKPTGLPLRNDKFVTCDTCHTRHIPTEQKQYIKLPYEDENTLCFQCHL